MNKPVSTISAISMSSAEDRLISLREALIRINDTLAGQLETMAGAAPKAQADARCAAPIPDGRLNRVHGTIGACFDLTNEIQTKLDHLTDNL